MYQRMESLKRHEIIFTPYDQSEKKYYIINHGVLSQVNDNDYMVSLAKNKKLLFLLDGIDVYDQEGNKIKCP